MPSKKVSPHTVHSFKKGHKKPQSTLLYPKKLTEIHGKIFLRSSIALRLKRNGIFTMTAVHFVHLALTVRFFTHYIQYMP